jgi:hypothetical protein
VTVRAMNFKSHDAPRSQLTAKIQTSALRDSLAALKSPADMQQKTRKPWRLTTIVITKASYSFIEVFHINSLFPFYFLFLYFAVKHLLREKQHFFSLWRGEI